MTQCVVTPIFRPHKFCLLQSERKPLHTNFNYTLLPIRHVRATTTTVSTEHEYNTSAQNKDKKTTNLT